MPEDQQADTAAVSTPTPPSISKADADDAGDDEALESSRSSALDRTVLVSFGSTQFRIRLDQKFQQRSFRDAVVETFIKAYNKRAKAVKSKAKLSAGALNRVELNGEHIGDLSARTDSLVTQDGMHAELFFPPPPALLVAPVPTKAVAPAGPYASFLRKVDMTLEQLLSAKELPFSNKFQSAADMEDFVAITKEHGPIAVESLYICARLPSTRAKTHASVFLRLPDSVALFL